MQAVVPVKLPEDLAKSVKDAAKELDLSQQAVIRQTLRFCLFDFKQRMKYVTRVPLGRSLWDHLKSGAGLELKIQSGTDRVRKLTL